MRYDGTSASVQAVMMAAIPVRSQPCAGRAILRRVSPVAQLEFMIPIVRKRSVDAAAACGGSRDNVDCAPSCSRVRIRAEPTEPCLPRLQVLSSLRSASLRSTRLRLDFASLDFASLDSTRLDSDPV